MLECFPITNGSQIKTPHTCPIAFIYFVNNNLHYIEKHKFIHIYIRKINAHNMVSIEPDSLSFSKIII